MSIKKAKTKKERGFVQPVMIKATDYGEERTRSRRNAASSIVRTDMYKNIEDGLTPFTKNNRGNFTIKDAIELCQKAYYNISIFRNTIDLMTEFSINTILLETKNKESAKFFEAWLERIGIWSLQDKFYREYFRSSTVCVAKLYAGIDDAFVKKISQTFSEAKKGKYRIPLKYVILNPASLEVPGISFESNLFYKQLTPFECERLRNPTNEDEKMMYDKLPTEVKKEIQNKSNNILIPLDSKEVSVIFYKKQDYEPFAVPMGYPVIKDLNWKEELKNIDMAISRTIQQSILLVNVGAELKDGSLYLDQKQIENLQSLLTNESVGRALVVDFSVKAEWKIPQIGDILDPKKYEVVNRDIKEGLNNILTGGQSEEKYANKSLNIKVFIERLKQARNAFLNEFLIPEIKTISKELGFKNWPMPYYEDIDFKDEIEYYKMYNRLIELGVLTPKEGFTAINTGRLPTDEESKLNQQEYKTQREDGLYQPINGSAYYQGLFAPKVPAAGGGKTSGRPSGTPAPKKVTPIGGSSQEEFSLKKIVDNMKLANILEKELEKSLLKKMKVKSLNEEQKKIASEILNVIISNEEPDKWVNSCDEYISNPVDNNIERISEIQKISAEHQLDSYMGAILVASKK